MKRFLFVVTGLLLASQVASARSPMLRDIRLELDKVPAHGLAGAAVQRLMVLSNGTVLEQACGALTRIPCRPQVVTVLSAHQMDRIDRLIERARHGRVVRVPSAVRCFVAPTHTFNYTADNGRVALKSGHMCLGWMDNVRPAADQLVAILNRLQNDRRFDGAILDLE